MKTTDIKIPTLIVRDDLLDPDVAEARAEYYADTFDPAASEEEQQASYEAFMKAWKANRKKPTP